MAFAVLAATYQAPAHAQVAADPDYWKQTQELRDTVSRFVYRQSPQAIPSTYDPVLEAEEILRQRQATLPPSNPQAPSLWQQVRGVTVKSGLSTPLRTLGTVGLVAGGFELGWKIGSGINAKFLKIGWPDPGGTVSNEQLVFRPQGYDIYPGYGAVLEMPFDGWLWTFYAANFTRNRWFHDAPPSCVSAVLIDPPRPPGLVDFHAGQLYCKANGGAGNESETRVNGLVTASAMPEHDLEAAGPIEDYTIQPYDRASPAPIPPAQSTVEQSIENELDKPENGLLLQWLNYQLGSPGEQDPVGDGVNVPQPATAPGHAADVFVEELDELGLTNVKFKVLSNPDFDPAFNEGAVVRVSPPPGTSVELGEEIVVEVNRTEQQQNNGECDRSARQDPGTPPSGDEFSPKHTFSGRDPDQGMAPTDVPFRWGTTGWGYRHVEIGHGWDNDRDRADTQAALYDPAPEPDQPGSHRFYLFYTGPNRIPCTRRVVARFDVLDGEAAKRGIITSFAHPGWYRRSDFD